MKKPIKIVLIALASIVAIPLAVVNVAIIALVIFLFSNGLVDFSNGDLNLKLNVNDYINSVSINNKPATESEVKKVNQCLQQNLKEVLPCLQKLS